MARPETIEDLSDDARVLLVGGIHLDHISHDATLMRYHAAIVEYIQKTGGTVSGTTYVSYTRLKNEKELEDALRAAQMNWDATSRRYAAIQKAELSETPLDPPYREYESHALRQFAADEGLPVLDTFKVKTNA